MCAMVTLACVSWFICVQHMTMHAWMSLIVAFDAQLGHPDR